jgi:hypothetical protein
MRQVEVCEVADARRQVHLDVCLHTGLDHFHCKMCQCGVGCVMYAQACT